MFFFIFCTYVRQSLSEYLPRISRNTIRCSPSSFGTWHILEYVTKHYLSQNPEVEPELRMPPYTIMQQSLLECQTGSIIPPLSFGSNLKNHTNPFDLCALPWTPSTLRKGPSLLQDLTRQTIHMWDHLTTTCNLSKPFGPMTPFFGTPAFPPAMRVTEYGPWNKDGHRRLAQVL